MFLDFEVCKRFDMMEEIGLDLDFVIILLGSMMKIIIIICKNNCKWLFLNIYLNVVIYFFCFWV